MWINYVCMYTRLLYHVFEEQIDIFLLRIHFEGSVVHKCVHIHNFFTAVPYLKVELF